MQDIFIQVCILGVLVPGILIRGVDDRNSSLLGLLLVLAMTGLWICVLWSGWSRWAYTYRILNEGSKRSDFTQWDETNSIVNLDRTRSLDATLSRFVELFRATGSEEGLVMATTLNYVLDDLRTSRRAAILDDFRTSGRILDLVRRGAQELGALLP